MNANPNAPLQQVPASPPGRGGAIALLVVGIIFDILGLLAIVVTLGNFHVVNQAELNTARIIGGALIVVGGVFEAIGIMKLKKRSGG
jgi:hypothetical protein